MRQHPLQPTGSNVLLDEVFRQYRDPSSDQHPVSYRVNGTQILVLTKRPLLGCWGLIRPVTKQGECWTGIDQCVVYSILRTPKGSGLQKPRRGHKAVALLVKRHGLNAW